MKLSRSLGLLQATALNMSNMVGIGPFITIPLIISAMGGPQCLLGWVVGATLSLCDGLVWSELAAAMPESGGTFHYLREIFRGTRLGGVLPFLFIWQFIFSGPLEIASGYIGFAQYLHYFWNGPVRLAACGVGILVIALLYHGTQVVGKMTVVLWAGMLVTVATIIGSGLLHFDAKLAFDFPPGAFHLSREFLAGLGGAALISMYDFLGYYGICYVGAEVRRPESVIPRSILYSLIIVGIMYVTLTVSILGVVPWREAMKSEFIAARFMEILYGHQAGGLVTVLVLWSALASVFALLLGYSRVPYAAAMEGFFFKPFAKLHSTGRFPHISLLVIGALSAACALLNMVWVLSALLTARILAQFIIQIGALHYMRTHRSDIKRPFRAWLYPVPAVIALAGWIFIYVSSGWMFALSGLCVLATGLAAYAVWKRGATERRAL